MNENLDLIYRLRFDGNDMYMDFNTLIIRGIKNRGKGIGTKVIKEVISESRQSGCKYILLKADLKQKQLNGFDLLEWYKKYGFYELDNNKGLRGMRLNL